MNYLPRKCVTVNGQDMMRTPLEADYDNRTILAFLIDDDSAAIINSCLRDLARISDEVITLYIMSPGGSVSAGLSIYDTCKSIRCDVQTVACGMAASMGAFLVAAAGTKGLRWAQPHAELLIHQPLGGTSGQASDMKIHVEHIMKTRETLNRILAEATGQTMDQIELDTERDKILNAQEALEYGLVDRIGDPISEL